MGCRTMDSKSTMLPTWSGDASLPRNLKQNDDAHKSTCTISISIMFYKIEAPAFSDKNGVDIPLKRSKYALT